MDRHTQEQFEEGMCGQDIEKFRSQNGLPTNRKLKPTRYHTDGIAFDDEYEDEDGEIEGDGVSCYY